MCGIFGVWNVRAEPVDPEAARRATAVLRHRGPDDEGYLLVESASGRAVACAGVETDARCGLPSIETVAKGSFDLVLGFRRLAILDISTAGHQPMSRGPGRPWIVFNGEIYNYRELRAELGRLGHEFRTGTDTETLLAAYEQWGEQCLERLNGMWAFALWDGARRQLTLARDRFGIKPLHYTWDGRRLAFASEIKALVGEHGLPVRFEDQAVYHYLAAGILPSPGKGETFFKNVLSLPPAHTLAVRNGQASLRRFWSLPRPDGPPAGLQAEEAAGRYRELFRKAVRLQLQADVPVGTCLSGGLDSSSLACVVSDLVREGDAGAAGARQKTFSAVYTAEGPHNERPHIERALERTGAEAHFTVPTLERLRSDLERLLWHQEEPFQTTSIFAQWCVMEEAHQRGVKVLLDGQGADESLGGYRPFSLHVHDTWRRSGLSAALAEARAIGREAGVPRLPLLAAAAAQSLPLGWVEALRRSRFRWRNGRPPWNPDFEARCGRESISDWRPWSQQATLDLHLRHLLEESSLPHLLRFEDRNSMAFSIEARVPYLDHELVLASFQEAAAWRIHHGWSKWVLRKAMEGTVPDEIVWRRDKVGFETPEAEWLAQWIRADPELFPGDALSSEYLDPHEVRRQLALYSSAPARGRLPVWRWINLELWMRTWLVSHGG
ncbi:MAG: asparagine synthase (glutamine-hydrolyzing) [Planctomycetes bacterium]|nr:asparagine synthase (glutamine-hydrolyzing) [Planctomycetota bacterium]